jgi:hypothetical protein
VKLTTFTADPYQPEKSHANRSETHPAIPIVSEPKTDHLLCLSQREALMLFGLLQAALRHETTRKTLLSEGEYQQFHRELSHNLARALARDDARPVRA